ncbi:hypothetical protein [Flavobacterium aurantiibacter]|uniref:Uncharacterized protein n=1 Tax=Flavobacterium aurantiibacter TaxID=2023067 RepID=A0A256AE40_9FLAO|nr:hypothetical protein [Flavobacterium aurantiibacter]OYQ51485.1 hypothetical protein CHX27_00325 [Flavobacterium aurantiibacter]
MKEFILELKTRNETLFYFGAICLFFALVCFILSKTTNTQVYQVNAYLKPLKFAFSTFLFSWAMAWYCYYLQGFNVGLFNVLVIFLMSFEIIYIAIMASKGSTSHFNTSTPFYALMFSLMAVAATLVTLYTAYVGILFFTQSFPDLPSYYVWAIRFSLIIFVIFSFQGFAMGARMSHSVGLENDNSNLFILGWSKTVGDLRVAHFIGMHALQILPVLSYYVLKNTKATIFISSLYLILAIYSFVTALHGKSIFHNPFK